MSSVAGTGVRAARAHAFAGLLWAVSVGAGADAQVGLAALAPYEGRVVGRIRFEGNRVTKDHVIRRELRTAVGQRLQLEALRADLQRLDNLDIFSSIRAEARELDRAGDDDGDVELLLVVRELPSAVPYVSYDISDVDGLSVGPALKSVNLRGYDVFVAGYLLYGGRTLYLLDLSAPWIAGNHVSLDLDVSRVERDNQLDGFRETSYEVAPRIGTYVGERGRAALSLAYLRVEADRSGHTLSGAGRDHLVRLGGSVGYDTRDSWGDPHRGWLNELEIIKTGGVLPGDGDFWTTHIDVRRYEPIKADHTLVLAGLLSLQSGRPGSSFPEYMDYHLGGANSIRGYSVNELGQTLKGRDQLLVTLEFRGGLLPSREYELLGQAADLGLSWALFADSGIAWDDAEQLSVGRAASGVGIGVRLLMPAVDMTRLDFAIGENGDRRVHFAVFSKMRAQRFRFR